MRLGQLAWGLTPALLVSSLASNVQLPFADAIQPLDLARVDARPIESCFDCVVQKY